MIGFANNLILIEIRDIIIRIISLVLLHFYKDKYRKVRIRSKAGNLSITYRYKSSNSELYKVAIQEILGPAAMFTSVPVR